MRELLLHGRIIDEVLIANGEAQFGCPRLQERANDEECPGIVFEHTGTAIEKHILHAVARGC